MTQEDKATRLKRLKIRSWRRGTKEMDLILGGFADAHLSGLTDAELDAHEALMDENDQDLYMWISEQADAPDHHKPALAKLRFEFDTKS